jgi:anthranilate synthase/aminodeoxychorismate synthase-like glutamine amidotransferase
MRVAFIDHYDSFSYNVLDWLTIATNGKIQIDRVTCDDDLRLKKLKNNPVPLVISPGPGQPQDYPQTLSVIESCMHRVPILGICLGHQMLGVLAGGSIGMASNPWHGTSRIVKVVNHHWLTNNLPDEFPATIYHSLIVNLHFESSLPWTRVAEDSNGDLMMLGHKTLPVGGVQFHPESFSSANLTAIARSFYGLF